MDALGLFPCDVRPRIFDAKQAEAFRHQNCAGADRAWRRSPDLCAARRATAIRLARAQAPHPPIINIVSNMLEPVGGVSHVRIVYPLQTLRTDPAMITPPQLKRRFLGPGGDTPRIFMMHRPSLDGRSRSSADPQVLSARLAYRHRVRRPS